MLLITNAYHDVVAFTLPSVPGGSRWICLVDTNVPEQMDEPVFEAGDVYHVTGRSLLLFCLQSEHGSRDRGA
jgi:glycogen operon protein